MEENRNMDEAVKSVGNLLKLAYNFAQATDVLMSSIALRLRRFGGMKQEKKRAFNHSHKKSVVRKQTPTFAPERRCSSRTFRYGYLVTT